MAKKTEGAGGEGKALAPIARGTARTPALRKVASATTKGLVPAVVPPEGIVAKDGDVTLVAGRPYDAHGLVVPAIEVYYDAEVRPKVAGPWLGEADKIAWRDPESGYECVVMRAHPGGFLCGYVGVPVHHPLHGFAPAAIPADVGIEVHGGITYGHLCQHGPTPQRRIRYESRRICHVAVGMVPIRHGSDYRVADANVWWLGFTCDHVADLVPGGIAHASTGARLGVTQVYRDDAYVCREVTDLAAQLFAIEEERPLPPRSGPPLPPASIDPNRRS